ncbi:MULTISPECIES: alpha/beta hydrolase family protein [Streptomyces]|uniref:alpha/beta hydrolase family protein n=1 Tax=Streptomyces TaxID=1883 RepID=UPI002248D90F|nr:alpha/beta hydrolase [Streptomyces sp. JHD 1]MCX2970250.1 alpha/beta hydrolase [Streptomyces sp. JHD 1]
MKHRSRPRAYQRLTKGAGAVALGTALCATGLTPASAADAAAEPEFPRGPVPTAEALRQQDGPFEIATATVPDQPTFDGGTLYYPTDDSEGTFGAIAVSPGYTGRQDSISWYGRTLASHGFVVFTIDTESVYDQPDARGEQLLDALDHITERSAVKDRVDPDRLAVAGHSMGGGGALRASYLRPTLRASLPITPYHWWKSWSNTTVPTMIFGGENDGVTPVGQHAEPFYESHGSRDKAYLELNDGTHLTPTGFDGTLAQYTVSWLKLQVDNDSRYERFLCPPPQADNDTIEEYRSTHCT